MESGRVHNAIEEGSIIRYTGLVQILDPQFVKSRFEQYIRLVTGIVGVQIGIVPDIVATPPVRREEALSPAPRPRKGMLRVKY